MSNKFRNVIFSKSKNPTSRITQDLGGWIGVLGEGGLGYIWGGEYWGMGGGGKVAKTYLAGLSKM